MTQALGTLVFACLLVIVVTGAFVAALAVRDHLRSVARRPVNTEWRQLQAARRVTSNQEK